MKGDEIERSEGLHPISQTCVIMASHDTIWQQVYLTVCALGLEDYDSYC